MKKIVSNNDRKVFYRLSLWIVISYSIMLGISLSTTVMNIEVSKYVNDISYIKIAALVTATIHTFLIIFNWIALKLQKTRIDYVKSSKVAWLLGVLMDVLSTVCLVCNTITALVNGNVLNVAEQAYWLLPFLSTITFTVSCINFGFAIYFLVIAKKAVKQHKTL